MSEHYRELDKDTLVIGLSPGQGLADPEGVIHFLDSAHHPASSPATQALGAPYFDDIDRITKTLDTVIDARGRENPANPDLDEYCDSLASPEVGQTISVAQTIMAQRILAHSGVTPDISIGVSLGGMSAGVQAGFVSDEAIIRTARDRDELSMEARALQEEKNTFTSMNAYKLRKGKELEGDNTDVASYMHRLIKENNIPDIYLSNVYTGNLVVLSGKTDSHESIADIIRSDRLVGQIPLGIEFAFHSPFMDQVKEAFEEAVQTYVNQQQFTPNAMLLSAIWGSFLNTQQDFTNETVEQFSAQVNLVTVAEKIRQILENHRQIKRVVFIETGPRSEKQRNNTNGGSVMTPLMENLGEGIIMIDGRVVDLHWTSIARPNDLASTAVQDTFWQAKRVA